MTVWLPFRSEKADHAQFWFFSYLPISSGDVYDRFGQSYDVQGILDADQQFNATAYEAYSPLYMSTTYVACFSIAFALSTAVLVHTALYHGQSIVHKLKNVRTEAEDVHAKLMRNYPEVPDWWYWAFLAVFVLLGIVANEVPPLTYSAWRSNADRAQVWDTGLPIWAMLMSVLIAAIYVLPGGFIYAMTAQQVRALRPTRTARLRAMHRSPSISLPSSFLAIYYLVDPSLS